MRAPPRVSIFATDVDEPALAVARAGRHPEALLHGLTEERRRRFFRAEVGSLVVAKELRDICVFSPHNILRDPPFSRIDLISCRNLLIYLAAEAQRRLFPLFHYALRPGGFLFLTPYREANGDVEGVVATSVNVTSLAKSKER